MILTIGVSFSKSLAQTTSATFPFAWESGSLSGILLDLAEASGLNLSVDAAVVKTYSVSAQSTENANVEAHLSRLFSGLPITYRITKKTISVLQLSPKPFDFHGIIADAKTGERLIGATICSGDGSQGVATNAFGYFSYRAKLPCRLKVTYVGYKTQVVTLPEQAPNIQYRIDLQPSITLATVVVASSIGDTGKDQIAGSSHYNSLSAKQVAAIPALGGEPDLMKGFALLPGVSAGADGIGGIHVRGGNADQNLVLLDDVPLYHPTHAFGLFSIFQNSIISDAKLYKGGFPARYDGRNSSVFDIRTTARTKGKPKFHGRIGTGIGGLSTQIPFAKGKGGFTAAYRTSFLNPVLKAQSRKQKLALGIDGELTYKFYDIHTKAHYDLTPKDRLYLSYYKGRDELSDSENLRSAPDAQTILSDSLVSNTGWGNETLSLRYNKTIGTRAFLNSTLIASDYQYNSVDLQKIDFRFRTTPIDSFTTRFFQSSRIQEYAFRSDLDYYYSAMHRFRVGGQVTWRTFTPGTQFLKVDGDIDLILLDPNNTTLQLNDIKVTEQSLYVEDNLTAGKWKVNAGLRITAHQNRGISKLAPQPRLSAQYQFNNKFTGLATGSITTQFMQLITASDAGLPNDLWVPTSRIIDKSPTARQASIGGSYQFNSQLSLKLEGYVKALRNMQQLPEDLAFDGNLSFIDATNYEQFLVVTHGLSRGVELTLAHTSNNLTAWLSYELRDITRSRNNRRIDYTFDNRHAASLFVDYKFGDRWSAAATWKYLSARSVTQAVLQASNLPLTALTGTTLDDGEMTSIPAYHRLDLQVRYTWGEDFEHAITFGAFNVYNQDNVIQRVSLNPSPSGEVQIRTVRSIPRLPTVSYSIDF